MKRLVVLTLISAGLLGGCATYNDYAYYERDGYYDGYYRDRYPIRRYYYDRYGNRVYIEDYDVSYRYGVYYGSAAWGYPDYLRYHWYYSVLWPVYRYYYDPFWCPGFYYGITFFPRTYFGLNLGWYSWPYYLAYAPYRYSYVDHYYDWAQFSRDRAIDYQRHPSYYRPRYGSARNEAQMLAYRTGARDFQQAGSGVTHQPGAILDPRITRPTRVRGELVTSLRGLPEPRIEPYGPDGRGYGGFTGYGAQSGARGQLFRGRDLGVGSVVPYDANPSVSNAVRGRGSSRSIDLPSSTPTQGATIPRYARDPYRLDRDPRIEASQESVGSSLRGRPTYGSDRGMSTSFLQTLPPPRIESVDRRLQRFFESPADVRGREIDRSHGLLQYPPRYTPSQPIERSLPRTFERVAPRPIDALAEPGIERQSPYRPSPSPTLNYGNRYGNREPAVEPHFVPRPAPSSRVPSADAGSIGGSRVARGQLERIIRDED